MRGYGQWTRTRESLKASILDVDRSLNHAFLQNLFSNCVELSKFEATCILTKLSKAADVSLPSNFPDLVLSLASLSEESILMILVHLVNLLPQGLVQNAYAVICHGKMNDENFKLLPMSVKNYKNIESEKGSRRPYSVGEHHNYSSVKQSVKIRMPLSKLNKCSNCEVLINRIHELENENADMKDKLFSKEKIEPKPVKKSSSMKKIDIDEIRENDTLMELHTGLPSRVFSWVCDEILPAASKMLYWGSTGGKPGDMPPDYLISEKEKPGPQRKLSLEEEFLVCLIYLKLNIIEAYLAFLFCVSTSRISQIISTWVPLLSRELKALIFWPKADQLTCYPKCFKRWDNLVGIIDGFEVFTDRPSHVENNTLIFSSYKNHATVKFLISCTPGGTINFISEPAGGNMSDVELFKISNILSKCQPGDSLMADKGFRLNAFCLREGVRLYIPEFTKKGKQFTHQQNVKNKQITNARIHI